MQRGVTPLEQGQWTTFLAFYAGLWTLQNVIRPARFALSLAVAPAFDRVLDRLTALSHLKKRTLFGALMVAMSLITPVLLFLSIWIMGGLPDGLGPLPPLRRF